MAKRVVGIVAVLFTLATLSAFAQFSRVPSQALVNALSTLRRLDDSSFQQVVWWAPNPSDPNLTIPDWNNAEHLVMQLTHKDRDAVLQWLNGHGRSALYDRGATDAMIGPRRPAADNNYTPSTPPPSAQYRILPLTSPTLGDGNPASGINVNSGFALIKKDATSAIVCLSFTNLAPGVASEVDFAFPLIDKQGDTVGTLTLARKGTFSPNIAINGPSDANAYIGRQIGPRGMYDNCVVSNQGTAALPFAQTRYVSYKVRRVLYANGTTWP